MAKEKKPSADSSPPLQEADASLFSIDKIRSGTTGSWMTKIIMGVLILVFAVGFLFMDPGLFGGFGGGGGGQPQVNLNSTVASVGEQSITQGQFLQAEQYQEQMMAQYGMTIGPNELLAMEYRTLQSMAGNVALVAAAQKEGIQVTDQEVDAKIHKDIDEQIKLQQDQNPAGFRRQVEARFGSIQGYKDELHQQMEEGHEEIRNGLLVEKLQQKIQNGTESTEETFKRSHTKLHVRQLVVDVPATPPDSQDPKAAQDKALAAAKAEMDKLVQQAKATATSANFVKLVKEFSDDAQTKSKGGDLGWKIPQEIPVDYPMRDALMNADGKIVGPLQDTTTKAYFLFFIEGRKLELPKDYAQKKEQYLKEAKESRGNQAWTSYQQKVTAEAQQDLVIEDPVLLAFAMQNEQIPATSGAAADELRKQAIDFYQQGLNSAVGTRAAAIRLQMATLYTSLKQPKKAVETLATAAKESPEEPQILLSYATALRENKNNDEAVKQLQAVSTLLDNRPATPSMFGSNPADALRFQVASEFEALGKKDLADAERKKIKPQQPPVLPEQ